MVKRWPPELLNLTRNQATAPMTCEQGYLADALLRNYHAFALPCLPLDAEHRSSRTPERELSPAAQPHPSNILMYRTASCSAHWQTQHMQQLLAPTPRMHTLDLRPHPSEPLPHAAGAQAVS